MVVSTQSIDPLEGLDGETKPEKTSPTPKLETKDRLELIKTEVVLGQNEEERETILLSSLQNFLHPDEQVLLTNLEKQEEPTEDIKAYLSSGAALLSAVYQAKTDKENVSIRELIDYFTSDPSLSIQAYRKALLFILNNPSSKVSGWFTSEAWSEVPNEARKLLLARSAVAEEMGDEPTQEAKTKEEEDLLDSVKDTAGKYSDEIKLAAIVGAIGIGMYAVSKWMKKQFGDESTEANATDNLIKYGAYAVGGAFVYGKVIGSDWVQDKFSSDNESFIHSRWSKAAIAFSSFEFGRAADVLFQGGATVEQEKQYEVLSGVFEVDEDRLPSIAKLNVVEFMEGKASTLLNLDSQKEADRKVRSRIQNYYYEKIKLIPNYQSLTMGQVFEIGIQRGIFTSVDSSDLPTEDQEEIQAQKQEDEARLAEIAVYFDAPDENMSNLNEVAGDLLSDIKELTEFSESWWGEAAEKIDHALFFNLFTDADDAHEYGDIKGIREYILSTTRDGLNEDKKVFAEMAVQVQGFQAFLTAHPEPTEWTAAEKQEFNLYKDKMLAMRQQLDSARREVNEQRQRSLAEDYEEITIEDLQEGLLLALHGLDGSGKLLMLEAQQVMEGDTITWALLITQVGGAGYQIMKDKPAHLGWTAASAVKGALKGPVQVFSLGIDMLRAKTAFRYSSKELLKMFFRGELSQKDLERQLKWVEKYAYLIEKGPVGAIANTRLEPGATYGLRAKLRDLLRLNSQLDHFTAWEDHFVNGVELGSDEATALRSHFKDADLVEIRQFYASGGAATVAARRAAEASKRIAFDTLSDGKVVIKVDGKVVNIAQNEDDALKMADELIAEAEKSGKNLDKVKLRNVWKFAGPLVQILGPAFTVELFYRIQTASSDEELQKIVAEEAANLISFFVGSKLTLEVLLKIKKPTDPKLAALYAVLSLIGGMATALQLDEPLVQMIERFLEKQPNGYEITGEAAALLESATLFGSAKLNAALLEKLAGKVAKTEAGVAVQKVSKEALETLGKRMSALAEKKFVKKLVQSCGRDAVKMLLRKAGWKGGAALGMVALDGPAPIGDALAALFLAWTAKDVYDLGNLIWEGYKLEEELGRRLPLPIARFDVKEPPSLIAEYAQVDQSNAEAAFEAILKEPNAVVRIQREEDAGYEIWTVENGEVSNLTIYDMTGSRIAGLNDADLQKIAEAQELIEAQHDPDASPPIQTSGYGDLVM